MLEIGTLKLKNWLIMAPMSGITNFPFRLIAKRAGAGLVTTEMVSAMGLTRNHERTFRYLSSSLEERPLSVQIFGSDPHVMAMATEIVVEAGADIVDINMGCPARKVVKTGAGGALLRAPDKVKGIISAVRKACPVPLTVKIRSGWSPGQTVACETARIIEGCGADAITIHPRFVTQGFSGNADWEIISKIKAQSRIPVIGNGDVSDPPRALAMKRETGCDGVMIGRGAIGNPWIFKQILDLEKGLEPTTPELSERKAIILEHFRLLSDLMGEKRASKVMRGFLLWYTKGLPHSSRFRGSFTGIKDFNTMITAMDSYFTTLPESTEIPISKTNSMDYQIFQHEPRAGGER
ncbi:MAG: tRNA dihydrouridine synthase DusB [Desulfobacteraceae bacterium]|nr:tRNA dihydrouridine synthase DusB [Desulfobacteraceae bacterium]